MSDASMPRCHVCCRAQPDCICAECADFDGDPEDAAIRQRISDAILAERKRCAGVAKSWGDVYNIGWCIADKIMEPQ